MEERLQKILANAGVASRRQAEKLIEEGRVRVNGHTVQVLGVRADPRTDTITVDGKRVRRPHRFTYVLVNKPRNVMSTAQDPLHRRTIIDLVRPREGTRLYPVGRLDFASEGLLILTNDGEFTRFMMRAGSAPKTYRVKVSGVPSTRTLDTLRRGVEIEGRRYAPCTIRTVSEDSNSWYELTLHEGQNRQIRHMFEAFGHRVMKLRRTQIGFLSAPRLPTGAWRHLTHHEVQEFYRRYGDGAGRKDRVVARSGPRPGPGPR